jgi:Reverse transcriptase (RNA-dependent DNA polymerase)
MQEKRSFSEENFNNFRQAFHAINWNFLNTFDCVNEQFAQFSDLFNTLFNLYFPIVSYKVNKNVHRLNPWMTRGLLVSRIQKNRLCSVSVKSPFEPHISNFKRYRNLYFKTLKASKQLYFQSALGRHQSDSKKTWEILRKAINNKRKSDNSILSIVVGGRSISDPEQMADNFNKFFVGVASSIVNEIHPSNNEIDLNFANSLDDANADALKFRNNPLSVSEIADAIGQLNDKLSQDENGISSNFVKKIALSISVPLLIIFKNSFHSGIIPSPLKISKIIPLFKSGDSASMDNYRPIAMLNVFSKIMEKIICNRLTNFLDSNNLISDSQYGFRKGHSTLHPMLHFMN